MLDYGFANYQMSKVVGEGADMDMQVAVKMGLKDSVGVLAGEEISMLLRKGEEGALSIEVALPEAITAPVQKGEPVGEITVRKGERSSQPRLPWRRNLSACRACWKRCCASWKTGA